MEVLDRFKDAVPGLVGVVILVGGKIGTEQLVHIGLVGTRCKLYTFTVNVQRQRARKLHELLECFIWREDKNKIAMVELERGDELWLQLHEVWQNKRLNGFEKVYLFDS